MVTHQKIFFNGDFNFPNMGNWSELHTTSFLDTIIASFDKGNTLSSTNTQIKTLYDFSESWLLTQTINENTRKNNILDLFFTNDENAVLNSEIIHNVSFSDHNLVKIYTNTVFEKIISEKEDYPYMTEIPKYRLLEGTSQDWCDLNSHLNSVFGEDILLTQGHFLLTHGDFLLT